MVSYLHATVVLEQGHQVTVLTDLVLDVPHQGSDTWLVAAVRITRHTALQEVLLLRILLQGNKELCHLVFLLEGGRKSRRRSGEGRGGGRDSVMPCNAFLETQKAINSSFCDSLLPISSPSSQPY